ncbi:hypothetical protein DesfrDRAFT_2465 [Solidesulfovibrio fructosivorans JJ]]|uniref:DUF2029 domain-containing protein n=1 Tax=Solidesulfovibrio fructosivorans JJ] TaxID=596151 RepID=E1JXW6_SOLFR|nr:hypothetical protein [Solidesulfovibrio fructosivorans]EFL50889.1 hypothetical protein DesfrDRAFT_2465 [Solidesulfovibrio fructosivorans JJ]]
MTSRVPWRENTLLAALVLVGGVLLAVFSERIFAGGGLGYDGCSYGAIITRYADVRSGALALNSGLYFRVVPALVIRAVMMALGIPLTVPHVITAFQIINVALLALGAWLFGNCCDRIGLSRDGKILGFIGIFINYVVLKYSSYYPVLLDTTSLVLGIVLAWLYLSRRTWWLLPAGIGAFFIGPNVGLQAFLLFLLPARKEAQTPPRLPRPVAATLSLAMVVGCWWLLATGAPHNMEAMAIALAAIGGATYCLSRAAGFSPADLLRPGMLIRLGLVAGLVLALTVLPRLFPTLAAFDWVALFFQYARTVLQNSVVRPGEFVVAHTLYFGPIMLAVVCLFGPVCRAARRLGGGWLLVVAFGTLQGLNPLSRQMVGILPFLVLPVCLVLDSRPLPRLFLWGMAAASLAGSKVWQHINAGADFNLPMEKQPAVWSRYLESTGYWMREADYRVQGVVVLAALILMAATLWRMRFTRRT